MTTDSPPQDTSPRQRATECSATSRLRDFVKPSLNTDRLDRTTASVVHRKEDGSPAEF